MFVVSEDVRALTGELLSAVQRLRDEQPLTPYLALVPGYRWTARLLDGIASSVPGRPDALPLPGGEFLSIADAAMRFSRNRAATDTDVYAAAREAVIAMSGEETLHMNAISAAASGFSAALAAGLTPAMLAELHQGLLDDYPRLTVLERGFSAFNGALAASGRVLPETAMLDAQPAGVEQYSGLLVFGFYDLSAAQERFLSKVVDAFRKARKEAAVFSPVPEGSWGAFAERTLRFFSKALGEEPRRVAAGARRRSSWQVHRAASVRDEAVLAVSLARQAVASGISPDGIVVTARDINPYLPVLQALLEENAVPFHVAGGIPLANLPAGRFAAAFVELANTFSPLMAAGRQGSVPVWSVLRLLSFPACTAAAEVEALKRLFAQYGIVTFGDLKRVAAGETLPGEQEERRAIEGALQMFERIVDAFDAWARSDVDRAAPALEKFVDHAAPGAEGVLRVLAQIPGDERGKPGLLEYLLANAVVRDERRSGVLIGDVMAVRGLTPEYLILMGVSEGVFPRRPGGRGAFSYDLRSEINRVCADSGVRFPLRRDALSEDRFLFAFLVASAESGAVTYSGEGAGAGLARMVREMFGEVAPAERAPNSPVARAVPQAVRDGYAAYLRSLGGQDFSPAEGMVPPEALPSDVFISPSFIENYLDCPYLACLRFLLGVPERSAEPTMDPAPRDVWGSAVHDALHEVFGKIRPGKDAPDEAARMARKVASDCLEQWVGAGRVRKSAAWEVVRPRLVEQIVNYVKAVVEENAVARSSTEEQFARELRSGKAVLVKYSGRIDRVDVLKDGSLRVVDYKTGSPDDAGNFKAQVAMYRNEVARSYNVDPERIRAELVYLDRPLSDQPEIKKLVLPSADMVDAVLGAVVDAVSSGVFVRYPDKDKECSACSMYPVCLVSADALSRRKGASRQVGPLLDAREAVSGKKR